MCYAIHGYFMFKSLDDVKKFVEEHTDYEDNPLGDKCFNLAKILANQFRVQSGAHNLERSTDINSCNGVFTSEFIFR